MSDDVCRMSATELVKAYKARQLSPVEVTKATLERIDRLNSVYNAFCMVDHERALLQARESEERWSKAAPAGAADGVPTTVKDLILTKGWPTLRGSRTIDPDQDWNEDAPAVARLREHGAVILGKTTTAEFGWKGVTDSPLTGVTRNPWNRNKTPGGSSGGAGTAAALGMGTLHLATDGGGSIRIPAAFCGVFGHKPTFGTVPVHPQSPVGTLWHQGPIVRHVADAALMLAIISGPDHRDWFSVPHSLARVQDCLQAGIRGLRIAYSRDLGYARVDPEIAALVDSAVGCFEEHGAHVDIVDPGFGDPLDVMITLWSVALALAIAPMSPEQRAKLDPPILEIAERGFATSAVEYRQAEVARDALGRHMQLFHQKFDLLITPQVPISAFDVGCEVPPDSGMARWWEWSPFTYPFNLTQQSAASLPCGLTTEGMPVAAQVVGRRFADPVVLRACQAYEMACCFAEPDALELEGKHA